MRCVRDSRTKSAGYRSTGTPARKYGEGAKARALADEARSIDPTADDTILRTLLKYHIEGAESALLEIGVANSLDVFNLKIALLLDLGRAEIYLP